MEIVTSTARARALDHVILSLGAFSAGFAALLPVFPIFAFYGLITCLIVMLTELLEPKL